MGDPEHYLPMARAAGEAGFHCISIPGSICYPREACGTGDRPFRIFTTGQDVLRREGIGALEVKIGMARWYASELIED